MMTCNRAMSTTFLNIFTTNIHPKLSRSYAISRFSKSLGVGRTRPTKLSKKLSDTPLVEGAPYSADSQLLNASQRPPTSDPKDGIRSLLLNCDSLIIERQLEMLNVFIGFEQSNKYSITNPAGEIVGFIAEEPKGFWGVMARQAFATHRPFKAVVMDLHGSPILWVRRPFAWINSRMYLQRLKNFSEYTTQGEPVLDTFAEVQQVWHLWRRRYDLFLRAVGGSQLLSLASEPQPEPGPATFTQFAKVDSGFLAWDFRLHDARGEEIAYISRAFRGFGREIFTDTGQYTVKFGPSENTLRSPGSMSLLRELNIDERALCLALAINIDFDYFSRHSHTGSGGLFHMSSWE